MSRVVWEEIHGFSSLSEYQRFVQYIETQKNSGWVKEIEPDPKYCDGMIYGGRWFQDIETGETWRLVEPDIPFKGLWEPVKEDR